MSINIRNLLLLALLCSIVYSTCISSDSHSRSTAHMLRIHDMVGRYVHNQQKTTDTTQVAKSLDNIIQKISDSVNPSTPSILETKNLENIEYPKEVCEKMTNEQKDPLLTKIEQTKTKVSNFSKDLKNEKVGNDSRNAVEYLQLLDFVLRRDCNSLNQILIGVTPLQTYINTNQSWILGGITLKNLSQQYINRVNKFNNITNCNDNNPFFNGIQCIKCSDSTPIFNISSSKCVVCPAGTKYDQPTKNCVATNETIYKPNTAAGSPKVLLGTNQTQKDLDAYFTGTGSECPKESPFVINGKCSSCPADKPYYSLESKNCAACPSGSTFNETTHKCGEAQNKPNLAASTPKVIIGANQTQKDLDAYLSVNGTECPKESPFVINGKCAPCPADKPYFSLQTKDCAACANGTILDVATHKCIQPPSNKPNAAAGSPKVILGANQTQKDIDDYFSGTGPECSADSPFVISGKCAPCPTDKPYFSLQTKSCATCPGGATLNTTTHKCPEPANKPNLVAGSPKVLLGENQTQKDIDAYFVGNGTECPKESPFVISGKCAPCPADKPYFSLQTKACTACPGGATLNTTTHKCPELANKPNLSAGTPKVLLGANQTQKDIDAFFSGTGAECPKQSPFVLDGKCVPCPTDKPYFSLQTKSCANCPTGFTLNPTTHKCVQGKPESTDVSVQSPTLKMNDNSTDDDWNKYVQENSNRVLCPVDKPYWNGSECILCPVYFNIITKKCDTCGEGLLLNPSSHKCEQVNPLQPHLIDLFNVIF